MMSVKKITSILGLLLLCGPLLAEEHQSLSELRDIVRQFIEKELPSISHATLTTEIGQLDPRLQLAACPPDQLNTYIPNDGNLLTATTIGLRCSGPKPWSLYMPVKLTVLAKAMTVRRPLSRGSVLRAEDLKLAEMDSKLLQQGYFEDPAQLVGQTLKNSLIPGSVVSQSDILVTNLINRGESVAINVIVDGIQVSTKGIALSDGHLGENIPVKNTSSNKVLDAKVTNKQQVEVVIG